MSLATPILPRPNALGKSLHGGRECPALDEAIEQLGGVERPLFVGKETPTVDRKFEQPWHRALVSLRASGMSQRDIARDLGMSETAISFALQQPWVQAELAKRLENLDKNIMAIIQGEAMSSLNVLLEIRDDKKASAQVRAKVCEGLLDRVFGKASQKVEIQQTNAGDPVAEAEALKREIAANATKFNFGEAAGSGS